MSLQTFLDEQGIHYRCSRHPDAFTAQSLASAEHVSGRLVIKPVVVRADGQLVMCALPACFRVDLDELKQQLFVESVQLVDEPALAGLFADCEPGAVPPIGRLYGMTTIMDESLSHGTHVTFQAGTHADAVTMTLAAYRRLALPELAHFGRPVLH